MKQTITVRFKDTTNASLKERTYDMIELDIRHNMVTVWYPHGPGPSRLEIDLSIIQSLTINFK